MPLVVVPVGFVMGPEYGEDGPDDREPWYWEVHLGDQAQQLSATEFSAWAATFADPPSHARLAVNRQTVDDQLRTDQDGLVGPIAEPGPVLDALIDRGLLIEFDPVEGALHQTLSRLQLFPQGRGIGNSAEDPQAYQIVFDDQELVRVSRDVYRLWAYASSYPNLYQACAGLAGSEPEHTDRIVRELATALPALVSSGAAFLDPVPAGEGR